MKMDFLERQEEGQHKLQLLCSLRSKKARLEEELQLLTRKTFDVSTGQDADRSGDTEHLLDILESYRLLGVSISTTDAGLTLRFDPLYENQYPSTDCYCVQLIKKGDNYDVGQHNLPPFIPVNQLEKKHLATSTAVFTSEIRNYLYAYVQRREGLKKVQEEFSTCLAGQVSVNLPVTYVSMRCCMGKELPDVKIKLQYSLQRTLPDSIDICFVEEADSSSEMQSTNKKKDRLSTKWKTWLMELDIYSAISKILAK